MKKLLPLIVLLALAGAGYYLYTRPPVALVLTGIVTTNDVVVSPQISGQIGQLMVKEGDSVKADQLIAVITPDELRADRAFASQSADAIGSQVKEGEAALRFQQMQTAEQIRQAESTLSAAELQVMAAAADVESAQLTFTRTKNLADQKVAAQSDLDVARTTYDSAKAKLDSLKQQAEAARAAVALARSNAEQVSVRRSQLTTTERQHAAADAQRAKADVRLAYTQLRTPIDALVDTLSVRAGEVVNPGQPVVTLINLDDLWVRADVEETYIDRVRIGDHLTVRLPSGVERQGTVFYRGADASFATQRDVSRTKRDIKTFEVRLRVDNRDRRLAVGMTAYVLLPVQ
jgi:multidrug resistance efflux pump